MGTAFRRRLSAAYIVLLLAFSLPVSRAFAQNPFSFDLNLAPNTSGALEGSASLRYRWASFAETVLMFSSTGFLEEYEEGGGTTTVIRSRKALDLDVFRIPSDLLALRFGERSRVSISGAFLANGVILDEDRYGQGSVPSAYVYYLGQRTIWLKPLLGVDLSCVLGPVSSTVYYRTSWPFKLNEYLDGSANYSTDGQTDFSVWDEGFETRLGGEVSYNPAPGWKLRGGVDWMRHIGHSVATSGGVAAEYVYESQSLEGSLTLTFPIEERRPMVGVAYAYDSFRPLELFSTEPYSNSRLRFIFGLEL